MKLWHLLPLGALGGLLWGIWLHLGTAQPPAGGWASLVANLALACLAGAGVGLLGAAGTGAAIQRTNLGPGGVALLGGLAAALLPIVVAVITWNATGAAAMPRPLILTAVVVSFAAAALFALFYDPRRERDS